MEDQRKPAIVIIASGLFSSFMTIGLLGTALRYKAFEQEFVAEMALKSLGQEMFWGSILIGGFVGISHFSFFYPQKNLTYIYRSTTTVSCLICLFCTWVTNWEHVTILWGLPILIPIIVSVALIIIILPMNDWFLYSLFRIHIKPYRFDVNDEYDEDD